MGRFQENLLVPKAKLTRLIWTGIIIIFALFLQNSLKGTKIIEIVCLQVFNIFGLSLSTVLLSNKS